MLTLALPADQDHGDAFREIDARWTRARALGAVPNGPAHPEGVGGDDLRERRSKLAEAFQSSMPLGLVPDALAAAGDAGYTALLADPDGIIVSAQASEHFTNVAARVRLVEGASWHEAQRGTNAIGTALFEGRGVAVVGGAHYERLNHGLVCYATPIRDPLGEIVAVFDVTSRVELANPLVGALVQTVAGALEQVLREAAYARAHPGGLGAVRALVERAHGPAFLVQRGGKVLASSRESAGSGQPWDKVAADWDWQRLALASKKGERFDVAGRTYLLEPIVGARDELLAVVALGALPSVAPRPSEVRRTSAAGKPEPATTATSPQKSDAFAKVTGSDPAILRAKAMAERFANTTLPILLLAETGTGKDLFAHAVHSASPRKHGPFVAVNCGAIAPTLLESELFGFAPGAFTGANPKGHSGRIGSASGGTLFLDEIGEMSAAAQAALLRVLEDGRYSRLGDAAQRQADVRIVCATCRDLTAMVAAGQFRKDLYYRIRGAVLTLPPLRNRTDLAELAAGLNASLAQSKGLPLAVLTADALRVLAGHSWPGNVRELKMVLEVALVLADGQPIRREHLPDDLAGFRTTDLDTAARESDLPLRAEAERSAVSAALAKAGGNLSRAAQVLGVARTTLYRMLRRHGLD